MRILSTGGSSIVLGRRFIALLDGDGLIDILLDSRPEPTARRGVDDLYGAGIETQAAKSDPGVPLLNLVDVKLAQYLADVHEHATTGSKDGLSKLIALPQLMDPDATWAPDLVRH